MLAADARAHTHADARPRPLDARGLVHVLAVALGFLFLYSIAPRIYADGDTNWHLATGRLILATGTIPATDPFSWTFAGRPWVAHEWLTEVLMALAYALAGWTGVALFFGLAAGGTIFVIGLEAARWLRPVPTAIMLILIVYAFIPYMLARPHVVGWLLLSIWLVALLRAREQQRAPALWLVPFMLAWANLHGSFVFGLVLIAPFALEALFADADKRRVLVGWGGFGLLALLAAICTPHGIDGLIFPLKVSTMTVLPIIDEWQPTVLASETAFQPLFYAGVFIVLLRGVQVPVFRLLIVIGLVYLAFAHVRHQALLAIGGALLLAQPLGRSFAAMPVAAPVSRRGLALAGAAVLAVIGIRIALPIARTDNRSNPWTAIAQVPAALRRAPVVNDQSFGGAMILRGLRPSLDGRTDMYGDAFTFAHAEMTRGDIGKFTAFAARHGVRWTLLPPGSPLVRRLDTLPGWRRAYADKWAVMHVRAQ